MMMVPFGCTNMGYYIKIFTTLAFFLSQKNGAIDLLPFFSLQFTSKNSLFVKRSLFFYPMNTYIFVKILDSFSPPRSGILT